MKANYGIQLESGWSREVHAAVHTLARLYATENVCRRTITGSLEVHIAVIGIFVRRTLQRRSFTTLLDSLCSATRFVT